MRRVQETLHHAVQTNEFRAKAEYGLLELKNGMQEEINRRRQSLFSMWSELEKTERELYALELDCQILTKEYQNALNAAAQSATAIKSEAYIGVFLYTSKYQEKGWYATYVPVVCTAPACILLHGATMPVILVSSIVGGVIGTHIAEWLDDHRPPTSTAQSAMWRP